MFEESPDKQTHRSSKWFINDFKYFKAVFLKSYKIQKSKADMPHKIIAPSIIKEIRKDYDFRIIGVYSTYSAILAITYMKLKKIPYWIEADGGFPKNGHGLREKFKTFLLKSAEGYFSPSLITDSFLIHYGADSSKIHRYPFTSLYKKDILKQPLKIEEKAEYKKRLNIKENKVIISVGQFIPRKGFDILLKALKDISDDVGIYLIGGKAPDEYIKLIKELRIEKNVHFIEFAEKQKLAKYYMCADLFVFPTREDIWGLVINEAMAYGLPIITTDRCGAGLALVSSENGEIVPSENVSALEKSLKKFLLLGKEDLYKKGNYSIKAIQSYTFENMAKQHILVFESLLKKKTF